MRGGESVQNETLIAKGAWLLYLWDSLKNENVQPLSNK